MLDIADELSRWIELGRDFAVATVVGVSGSAPRQPGAALAVDEEGHAIGSVSGGCVEGAAYELCREAIADGVNRRERFGYSNDDAFAVGLTCGGAIDILVTPVRAEDRTYAVLSAAVAAATAGQAAALARIVSGPAELVDGALLVRPDGSRLGGFGDQPELDDIVAGEALAYLDAGRTAALRICEERFTSGSPVTVLIETSLPAPRMIVFGAIDYASALVKMGKFLGYHVTVCDARPAFATAARFPDADEIVVEWPHRYLGRTDVDGRTVVCVLTHDAKFDIPLLHLALRLPVAYIGAMGSRRTHLDRTERLREAGVTEAELARLHSPIGIDLGARTPEEVAVSIASEIVANMRGGSGVSLTGAHTAIHHDAVARGQGMTSFGSGMGQDENS
ncbi:xanthine dehydrogenase accessory factor [Streptomyces sp. SAI-135]|uniref:XdhC family protein n=1 Tax=unclassified Streptomyces TaxID=2593676 RepID=UPI00247670D9|nr:MULTISPECIES: XdhC/CoxI family protein [unclassified Streptomyces]MDH6522871.1 xanthine dehydrogenase accessory factor [Streptomyces sp. SAI-090]MDH6554491.1 xanthine dehydrogenase accessory factor [Streptomyces sp. SAI-041]MDH6613514.1 xanthine dehydrogenase accessory factor [Streptomyces sp. SAI-135]